MDFEQFFRLLPGETALIIRQRRKFEQDRFETVRAANHELAQLMSFAVHGPAKMPKYAPVVKRDKPLPEPTEAGHELIKAYFKSMIKGAA